MTITRENGMKINYANIIENFSFKNPQSSKAIILDIIITSNTRKRTKSKMFHS